MSVFEEMRTKKREIYQEIRNKSNNGANLSDLLNQYQVTKNAYYSYFNRLRIKNNSSTTETEEPPQIVTYVQEKNASKKQIESNKNNSPNKKVALIVGQKEEIMKILKELL